MSFNIRFLTNDTEPAAVFESAKMRYVSEKCGVCEKNDADIFWPNPNSRWAHLKCVNQITPIESNLTSAIDELFKDDQQKRNIAHSVAIKAIKEKCGNDSISTYTEKNGTEAITNLFSTIGVEAAKRYAIAQKDAETDSDFKTFKTTLCLTSFLESHLFEFPAAKL